jgi:hypothetical protein
MYRESDSLCTGFDSAPNKEKFEQFRETLECLTQDSSKVLFEYLRPRLIISGHTHHYCLYSHSVKGVGSVPEYSVPSFNWRNRNDPSFFLGHITHNEFYMSKCLMPKESTVQMLYLVGILVTLLIPISSLLRWFIRLIGFINYTRR